MTGTVTSVEVAEPAHLVLHRRQGRRRQRHELGHGDSQAPNLLVRNGWTKSTLKAGDVVNVEGYGSKDAKNIANARTIVITATGQRLVAGSSAGSAP